MRVRLTEDCDTADLARWPSGIIPRGTELNEPTSHHLLDLGVAEPAGELANQYVDAKQAKERAQRQLDRARQRDADDAKAREVIAQENQRLEAIRRKAEQLAALGMTDLVVFADPPTLTETVHDPAEDFLPAEAVTDLNEEPDVDE